MKLKLVILLVAFTILPLMGCASDEADRYYLKRPLASRNVKEVKALSQAPKEPYTVIADLQAKNASVRYLREKAARIGADAIIVVPANGDYAKDSNWLVEGGESKSYDRLLGTAIIYNDEE